MKSQVLQEPLFHLGDTTVTLEKILVFLVVLLATLVASRLLQRGLVRGLRMRGATDEGTLGVARRLLHYVIVAVGMMLAFESIGISLGTLFAAGAVFAIGLGFAMQNIAQNFVSGVILLAERTIKPGDVLQVDNRFVRVVSMGIRATIARTLDEEEIIVPNSFIVQSVVTNFTLRDSLYRLRCPVGVTYSSDMALVMKTLAEAAAKLPWRVPERDPVVLLSGFGSSSVDFEVSVWVEDPWRSRGYRSEFNQEIWWALKKAGVVIAFPQLDLHLDPEVSRALSGRAEAESSPTRPHEEEMP